jgi:hypothetical protein
MGVLALLESTPCALVAPGNAITHNNREKAPSIVFTLFINLRLAMNGWIAGEKRLKLQLKLITKIVQHLFHQVFISGPTRKFFLI